MSNLLSQASLVMIPSGYKEDVVYSQIPTNGNGDLSFTRASNGTRINSAGLVEVCPWNLVQNSEQYNAGTWSSAFLSISANATTAPNGTTTADLIYPSSSQAYCYISTTSLNVIAGQTYTQSVYFKSSGFRWGIVDNMAGSAGAWFDLLNGVVGNVTSGCTASIENIGNGWYRCSVSSVAQSGTNYADFRMSDANGGSAVTANGTDGLLVWGFQLNIGSTAKPYFPTTDRLNVPRLTYQNGGGGCPSLLLEKQSTNQILYSQEMDNALWLKGNLTISANDTTSPDGTQNADKVTNTNTSAVYLYQKSQVSASTWSYSFYAKKGTNKYLGISLCSETYQATSRYQPVFNLDNGTLQAINQSGSNETNTSYSINAVGNGWYKITASFTLSAGADFTFIVLSSSNNTSYNPSSGNLDWQNATIGDYYIWGVQGEASSYPTSYIPTTSASATRVADECSKTGISSLIGQSQGTLFADVDLNHTSVGNTYILQIFQDSSNRILLYRSSGDVIGCYILKASGSVYDTTSGSSYTGRTKIAFAYKSGDIAFYINGTQIGTSSATYTAFASLADLNIDSNNGTERGYYNYNQVIVFPTRLTNAELASLTTI